MFPWEGKPQHIPKRVFPASEAPPPTVKYIESEAKLAPGQDGSGEGKSQNQGQDSDADAGSPPLPGVTPPALHVQAPSPPTIGLPGHLTYANAWDTVPSIQKYASKLVRPHHQYPFQHIPYQGGTPRRRSALGADDEGWRRWEKERERHVQARQDASSMDGDDEDDGDDDDDWDDQSKKDGNRVSGSPSSSRSRSGSTTSVTAAGKGKKYRGRGVQTIPVEVRNQAVQVKIRSSSLEADGPKLRDSRQPPPSAKFTPETKTKHDMASSPILAKARLLPPPTLLPPAPVNDFRDQMGQVTPGISQSLKQTIPFPSTASPTGLRSPQVLGSPRTYSPPKAQSPHKVPSPPKVTSPPRVSISPKMATPPMSGSVSPVKLPSTLKGGASPRRLSSGTQQQFTARKSSLSSTPPSKPESPKLEPAGTSTPPPSTPPPKPKLTSPFGPAMVRSTSNETNLTSSPSTQGAPLTPDSTTGVTPVRKAGRVWDPARGVDVFKRSSEEVLARFLRMGSFEEDERRQSQVQQQE